MLAQTLKPLFCCLVVAGSLLLPSLSLTAEGDAALGRTDCRFSRPLGWNEPQLVWEGGCNNGKADALGVLRAYTNGLASRLFLGRMRGGEFDIGVIDLPEGYIAGRFVEGKAVQDGDRNVIINAFREASSAAKLVGELFRQAGNSAAADFYLEKSRKLAEQMD
jgi:hypothetical protein